MNGKLVLSDDLLILLETFPQLENPKKQELKLYKKLIKAYEPTYATNYEQLERIKDKLSENRYNQLIIPIAKSTPKAQTLEQLAQNTLFKLILTTDDTNQELPYYNINNNNPFKALTYHCKANDSREPLKRYLSLLCSNAKTILICDNYFASNWNNTQSLLLNILPRNEMLIEFIETAPNTAAINNSEKFNTLNICEKWQIKASQEPRFQNCHDRYLIIDNKIEVIFSSGFDYLFNQNKELNCIFREI